VTSLCDLFTVDRDPSATVAWRFDPVFARERAVPFQELRDQVARLHTRLDRAPAGAWLVEAADPYACAISLLALWSSGRAALLPPNLQPGSLDLLETRAEGVLSDRPELRGSAHAIDPLDVTDEPSELGQIGRDALALELFTSGSTGEEKKITKRIRHLEDEVLRLEEAFGRLVDGTTLLCTAAPHHLYGLLFGLLWPLAAGRPFHARQLLRPSELVPRARRFGPCALVSVPSHLRRLAQHRSVEDLRSVCRAIFSSGGPLPRETAHGLARTTGISPVEVFGSTETGGIGWRSQRPDSQDDSWRLLPGVELVRSAGEESTRVRSAFVSVGDPERGYPLADRIERLADGRFVLRGRTDRTVKVGEKRLDLSLMESDLRSHDLVADAALLIVERAGEARVAAALVLTPAGERRLRSEGRRGVSRLLAAHLARSWDPVLLPRLWRAVPALPEDERGKHPLERLRALFDEADPDRAASAVEDRPERIEASRSDDRVLWRCRVPQDLSCWPGHFPGFPVVPGVLQLDWVMDAAADLLGESVALEEISQVSFHDVLGPGDEFVLEVALEAGGWLRFRVHGEGREHSIGRAKLAVGEEPRS
jgi:acyl-CoA synthetase (AMP-forming)/AMP-acid ligase II